MPEHFTLYRGTGYQGAFPDIVRLADGGLLTVFRQAPARPGHGDPAHRRDEKLRHFHLDPESRIVAVRSGDDGASWSVPVVIDTSDGSQDLNMPVATQLRSGEVIVLNHRWDIGKSGEQIAALNGSRFLRPMPFSEPFGSELFDSIYMYRSSDVGHTWSGPEPVTLPGFGFAAFVGKTAIVELADGAWMMPIYGTFQGEGVASYHVLRSRDGGRSWGEPTAVARDPHDSVGFYEPPILDLGGETLDSRVRGNDGGVDLGGGRLLTMMRTEDTDGHLFQASSSDGGWVWTGLRRSPIWGYPCHLLRLRSGRVLCSYGYRREPFGVRAVTSGDDGETWDMDNELVIRDDGLHHDLGYPASVQLGDGRILTVYYFHDADGVRYIGGSTYSESDVSPEPCRTWQGGFEARPYGNPDV